MKRILAVLIVLIALALACGNSTPTPTLPPPTEKRDPTSTSTFQEDETAYGFFPSPHEFSEKSILGHFQNLGNHADFILLQPNVPWEDFSNGKDAESKSKTDLQNQILLAQMNDMSWILVVDPLNGLNRREFQGLPQRLG